MHHVDLVDLNMHCISSIFQATATGWGVKDEGSMDVSDILQEVTTLSITFQARQRIIREKNMRIFVLGIIGNIQK